MSPRPSEGDAEGSLVVSAATLIGVDAGRLRTAMRNDPELQIAARYLTCRIRLEIDDAYMTVLFVDGSVVDVVDTMTGFDPYDIVLSGPATVWRGILEPVPAPFYQDFWSARFMHGFRTEGDLDTLCAYYGAIRRMGDLMREIAGET